MPESSEQLTQRMGFDMSQVEQGYARMRAKSEVEAAKTRAIWAEADRAMAADHKLAVEAMIAQEERYKLAKISITQQIAVAQKAAAAEQAAAQQVANVEIAGGSGAADLIAGGLARKNAQQAARELEMKAASAALSHESHRLAGIFRETGVLFREGIRGNFTKMIGSFTVLAGLIGSIAIPVILGLGAVLGISELIGGPGVWKTYKAIKGREESEKSLKEAREETGSEMSSRIEALHRAGRIDDKQLANYKRALKRGDVDSVLNATNPLLREGSAEDQAKRAETEKEIDRIRKQSAENEFDAYRAGLPTQQRIWSLEIERHNVLNKMTRLRKDSLEYAQAEAEASKLHLDIEREKHNLAEDNRRKNEEDKRKQDERDQQATDLSRRINQNMREMAQDQAVYPTIENLAGRQWSKRFSAQYGAGGRFDLGRGNGPLAQAAREYLRAKYQQEYDRSYLPESGYYTSRSLFHGNGYFDRESVIENDRARMRTMRDRLITGGAASPEMHLEKISENTDAMIQKLNGVLRVGGKVKLTDDDE